jgi:hypothetical protein
LANLQKGKLGATCGIVEGQGEPWAAVDAIITSIVAANVACRF